MLDDRTQGLETSHDVGIKDVHWIPTLHPLRT
jgi:hypothetical protein